MATDQQRSVSPGNRPNVVIVMTDDQGYGDLGCTGNPWLSTPNIDEFARQSVRCNDFHVSPLCTPTRAGFMTGRNPLLNGAWATAWGRSILRREEVTLAQVFAANGYHTGLFGKWHLGDTYPYRPQDRGFSRVVAHKGGGVGQTPDFWGNSYFDDTYFRNGEPTQYEGYCTDIWFEEAMAFIDSTAGKDPFLACVMTNAPHSPYFVADRYAAAYRDRPEIPESEFYGMITNIDENFGRLRRFLTDKGLADNTIIVFLTDNGTSGGARTDADGFVVQGYNAGLRGVKASYYDGGHRVPFFLRYPDGDLTDRDVDGLTCHFDVLPTMIDLCGLTPPPLPVLDGTTIAPALRGVGTLPARYIFLQNQQQPEPPEKWHNVVLTPRWRLVFGRELYDINSDPGQLTDVAADNPGVVAELRAAHEAWWTEIAPTLVERAPLLLGHAAENPVRLDAMDVMGDIAWDQPHVREAKHSSGKWYVEIAHPGRYRFSLRRWPAELGLPIDSTPTGDEAPGEVNSVELNRRHGASGESNHLAATAAELVLNGQTQGCEVTGSEAEISFERNLEPSRGDLEAHFIADDGERHGAYYVYVERLMS